MSRTFSAQFLKLLPSVHELSEASEIKEAEKRNKLPLKYTRKLIRDKVELFRAQIISGVTTAESKEEMFNLVLQAVLPEMEAVRYRLKPVVNATGTVLHTNLGRARLSREAARHVSEAALSYSSLEYDISTGKRGSRMSLLEELLTEVTGTEAAVVVNNNAAAVYFVLTALAKNKEVIVSRGELVEIGGSFRVSSIMEESGARLVETGTTNKTRTADYINALTDETSMAMKVHTSNFAIVGFTESVNSSQLRHELNTHGREDVIVYDDLGSGSLYPFSSENIGDEPVVGKVVENGADLVSFSGDKLLGGPQAGIIAGKKELIDKLKKHQLARVLRLDKLTIAALEATLFEYLYGENPKQALPAVRDITKTQAQVREWTEECTASVSLNQIILTPEPSFSKVGGGTMPLAELPTYGLSVEKEGLRAADIEKFMRSRNKPVVGRILAGRFYMDMRTVEQEDWAAAAEALKELDVL
ncbi:L-seryl-tRNA(Sec) selenium transferase [Alkalicoccus saliphilus]|uniref:L-seryl-tRNA(Sec) selenium transferase n=1 Tax=Alkalicoccus saliphilus TaxID=200989 RepID=A0A2T4U7W9_9BACI|nr:L-seryl-tRNA(Sec) selenium transferase [Alkalicoccus saliphilus]PTL39484.1 L-seryl-tRNA(Sec) selenium transferase [Alkalicoccus saliphilus]